MANRTIIRLFRPLLLLTCYYCRQQQSTSHISTLHISCLMYSNDLHFNCTDLIYCACLCLRLREDLGFVGDMSLRSEHFDCVGVRSEWFDIGQLCILIYNKIPSKWRNPISLFLSPPKSYFFVVQQTTILSPFINGRDAITTLYY